MTGGSHGGRSGGPRSGPSSARSHAAILTASPNVLLVVLDTVTARYAWPPGTFQECRGFAAPTV